MKNDFLLKKTNKKDPSQKNKTINCPQTHEQHCLRFSAGAFFTAQKVPPPSCCHEKKGFPSVTTQINAHEAPNLEEKCPCFQRTASNPTPGEVRALPMQLKPVNMKPSLFSYLGILG